MTEISTRIIVADDGKISLGCAEQLAPGAYQAVVTVPPMPDRWKPFSLEGWPIDHRPWDDSVSLRREDLYGDAGR